MDASDDLDVATDVATLDRKPYGLGPGEYFLGEVGFPFIARVALPSARAVESRRENGRPHIRLSKVVSSPWRGILL